jgi:competence protein ComEC
MKNKFLNYILIILICLNLVITFEFFQFRTGKLEIYILDIGQGDSILIKTPENRWGLIDGGPDSAVLIEVDEVISPFTDTLEFMIFTHGDDDHIDGLNDLMRRYSVNYAFIHKVNKSTETYQESKNLILEKEIKNFGLFDANDFEVDGVEFNILWPEDGSVPYSAENVNNTSISVEIIYKDFEFIGMGDLEEKEELEAIKNVKSVSVDFLKVSHHGSNTSTSDELLSLMKPKVALISAAEDNKFGHPTKRVLELLEKFNIVIFRTDTNGRIKVSTNGSSAEIKAENKQVLLEDI